MRRLIPFLILVISLPYLDRVNVTFAKLHMNQRACFTQSPITQRAAFGLGALTGFFHRLYFLFEGSFPPSSRAIWRAALDRPHQSPGERPLGCVRLLIPSIL